MRPHRLCRLCQQPTTLEEKSREVTDDDSRAGVRRPAGASRPAMAWNAPCTTRSAPAARLICLARSPLSRLGRPAVEWLNDGHIAMVQPDHYARIIPATQHTG